MLNKKFETSWALGHLMNKLVDFGQVVFRPVGLIRLQSGSINSAIVTMRPNLSEFYDPWGILKLQFLSLPWLFYRIGDFNVTSDY